MEAFEIAQIIAKQKDANKQDGTDTSEAIDFVLFQIVADFEDYFESDNPNFDRNKFRVSCGF